MAASFWGELQLMDALMMAVWRRGKSDALLNHSDQGSQYTGEQFQRLLAENEITCLMSRAGNVWDRAMGTPLVRETMARSEMESFFSSLKTKRAARKVYRTAAMRGRMPIGRLRTCQPLIWKMRCTVFLLKPRSQATVR